MKNESIIIRPMKSAETRKVAALAATIIKSLKYYTVQARAEELAQYTGLKLREKIKNDPFSILVAESKSKIIGFLFSKWNSGTIWLEWIGTEDTNRRKGVARMLLQSLERTVSKRKAHKIWCDCRTVNIPSKKLLSSSGYHQLVVISNHWFKQDYILWHKEIC